jgi:hypothetical protein
LPWSIWAMMLKLRILGIFFILRGTRVPDKFA